MCLFAIMAVPWIFEVSIAPFEIADGVLSNLINDLSEVNALSIFNNESKRFFGRISIISKSIFYVACFLSN